MTTKVSNTSSPFPPQHYHNHALESLKTHRTHSPSASAWITQKPSGNFDEILREIGDKTFHYKNPPTTDEIVNWREKTDREMKIFVQKASMFAIVCNLDGNIDQTTAMEIVNEASQKNRSVFSVFLEKNKTKLTFWQKLSAFGNYLLYYQSGIIPNTLNTFMNTFLGKLRVELVQKEGGRNLATLNDKLLTEISSFLDLYINAVESYARGEHILGSRDQHIGRELSGKLGMSMAQICDQFAHTALRVFLPRVPFFEMMKSSSWGILRFTGKFLDATIGRLLNRIVRKGLEIKIPAVIATLVKTSTNAAQPTNLPFVVSITQGILEQLRKFKVQLAHQSENTTPADPVTGIKQLPDVVKKLIEVLEFEPFKTRKELNSHLKGSRDFNPISPEIHKSIEESTIDGCRAFLSYLSNPRNSEEIFYQLLNLSNAPFNSKPPSTPDEWKALNAKYDALKKEMRHEAREVFQTVIHRSVKERIQGMPESRVRQITRSFEAEQRERSLQTAHLLQDSSIELAKKSAIQFSLRNDLINEIEQSLNELENAKIPILIKPLNTLAQLLHKWKIKQSLDWTDIQKLQKILTIIEPLIPHKNKLQKAFLSIVFAIKESVVMPTDESSILPQLDQMTDAIENFKNLAVLNEKNHFSESIQRGIEAAMLPVGKAMNCVLDRIITAKNVQMELLENAAIHRELCTIAKTVSNPEFFNFTQLKSAIENLKKRLANSEIIDEKINAYVSYLEPILSNLEKETRLASHLRMLSRKDGILEKLFTISAARLAGSNTPFKWKESHLLAILNQFPANEREIILASIKSMTSSQTQEELQEHWLILKRVMREHYQYHWEKGLAHNVFLETQHQLYDLENSISSAHNDLVSLSHHMTHEIERLSKASHAIRIRKIEPLPNRVMNSLGGIPSTIGMIAGATAGWVLSAYTPKLSLIQGSSPAFSLFAGVVLGGITGKIGGEQIKSEATSYLSDHVVFPKVMRVFDNLYEFVLQPHVWKWAVTDALKTINETFGA